MTRDSCLAIAIVSWFGISFSAFALAEQPAQPPATPDQITAIERQQAFQQLSAGIVAALGLGKSPEPVPPEWFPLDPKVQVWTDQVLAYWEKRSSKIKTLECTFKQWEYDPQQIPNVFMKLKAQGELHRLPFTKYASGVIKYASPDKALFRTKELQYIRALHADVDWKFDSQPPENATHWITDGKRVITLDATRKEVIEMELPQELRGKPLWEGPFSFLGSDVAILFGGRAEAIHERYWIRPLQADAEGEYLLEAVPKTRRGAAQFQSVQIVLDENEYLPIKLQIFAPRLEPDQSAADGVQVRPADRQSTDQARRVLERRSSHGLAAQTLDSSGAWLQTTQGTRNGKWGAFKKSGTFGTFRVEEDATFI
jgi:TIGR03009 family protein